MNPTRKVLLIILGVGVFALILFSLTHQNPDALPTAAQPPGDSGSGGPIALLIFVASVCIYFIPTVVANYGTVDILDERADASGGRGYRQDRAAELGESGWPNCARERARRACA